MHKEFFLLSTFAFGWAASGAEMTLDFSQFDLNKTPPGFRSTLSGSGQPGDWKVIETDAPTAFPLLSPKAVSLSKQAVLAQLAQDRTDEHFPLLVYEQETFGDFTLTTHFKLVAGEEEQMAGIAFRLQDEGNYYYIRASGLGNSFYFYKVVGGVRSLPIGAKIEIKRGVWHDLTIECKGNRIRGLLDGKEVIPFLNDKSFTSGKIGFWTKSDSVTYFGNTRLVYTPREILAQVLVRDALKKYPRLEGLKIFAPADEDAPIKLVASTNQKEVGELASDAEKDVIARSVIYSGKSKGLVMVTMPLHDSNGDSVAAVSVLMKSFPGQTEKNAIARALPVVKEMEARVRHGKELVQ